MARFTHHAVSRGDDLDARCARLHERLLDGIEDTLDALATQDSQRAAIARAIQAKIAPLMCRHALCRRAQRCRRQKCTVAALRPSQ
jgi:hypothetical protein